MNQDKARECAEELIAGIVTALRKTGNLVEGAEIEPAIKAAQNIIAKHFPPSVHVNVIREKAEAATKDANDYHKYGGYQLEQDKRHEASIYYALIAEAK